MLDYLIDGLVILGVLALIRIASATPPKWTPRDYAQQVESWRRDAAD